MSNLLKRRVDFSPEIVRVHSPPIPMQDVETFDFNPEHYLSDLAGTDDQELHTFTSLASVQELIEIALPEHLLRNEYSTQEFDALQ